MSAGGMTPAQMARARFAKLCDGQRNNGLVLLDLGNEEYVVCVRIAGENDTYHNEPVARLYTGVPEGL